MKVVAEVPLIGGGGEPVDLRRVLASHGVASLAPQRVDMGNWALETTLMIGGAARTVRVRSGRPGLAVIERPSGPASKAVDTLLVSAVRHLFRLDDDLSAFYTLAGADVSLAWATSGAGRMLRSLTVFEDVVKTICTTNCAWSATVRMTNALVSELGELSADDRRAFPSPAAMAEAGPEFYDGVARAGYRGAYLRRLAMEVSEGRLDLEVMRSPEVPDAEVEKRLLALPGVGPYAAAHIMLTSLGRYQRLVLDSWTRPTYAKLTGRPASDKMIERRFRRYGKFAGLAFWLYLTEDWVGG